MYIVQWYYLLQPLLKIVPNIMDTLFHKTERKYLTQIKCLQQFLPNLLHYTLFVLPCVDSLIKEAYKQHITSLTMPSL